MEQQQREQQQQEQQRQPATLLPLREVPAQRMQDKQPLVRLEGLAGCCAKQPAEACVADVICKVGTG